MKSAESRSISRPVALSVAGRGCFRASVALVLLVLAGTGCQTVQGGSPEPTGPSLPAIALERDAVSRSDERRAAELLTEAETALREGRVNEAVELATEIVDEYPATGSSGAALWVRARALGTPDAGADQAIALADLERLRPLMRRDDPRWGAATLLHARVLSEAGRSADAVEMALELPADMGVGTGDFTWIREVVARLDRDELRGVTEEASPRSPLAAPVWVALGRTLGAEGAGPAAREAARTAISAGAFGPDLAAAEALLEGEGIAERTTLAERIPIAAILPNTGSPALRRFAEEVREGVLAAVTAAELEGRTEVEVYDDAGQALQAAGLVSRIEEAGSFGVVGPLQDAALAAAARARTANVPVVSPTAFALPEGEGDVYSLGSLDPGSARTLARWAGAAGISTVAMIHPSDEASVEEARIFREAFEAEGGAVVRELVYPPGLTFFQEQILGAAGTGADALVLPVPAADVEALAPQITFYGVDTLGIQVLGTAAWTDAGVRDVVADRHLSGVVTASPDLQDGAGFDRFVEAYETRFRRTLVDPGGAVLGYDAASLLMEAARTGARSPDEMADALERITDFPGASGVLSVEDGRIVRRHEILCYVGGERVRIPDVRPVQRWRAYPPPADTTDTVPPGPGRRDGFACPGTPAADSASVVFYREGGDTLYPRLVPMYRANDALPRLDPDSILPGTGPNR
ncbi:MAG TPA: ABC transporter substrate-binding protein [Longimicrobiales bacterium]|nr:ABC transporter substrate-binding protein [Longimicrobiales bacterium]